MTSPGRPRLVVGMSGSSAPQLGLALLRALHDLGTVETHLVVTKGAVQTLKLEADIDIGTVGELADVVHDDGDLAERLGVGRNSIREGLRELQMLGLVESRRGAGTFVRAAGPGSLMAPFQTVISLSAAAVDDVMEFRRVFEPEVAAMAARNIDDHGIALLATALRRFDDAIEAKAHPVDADVDFHEVVAQCTGNALVIAVQHALAQLFGDMRQQLSETTYQAGNRVARGHQALFGAIVAGDPEAARDVMLQHLEEVEGSLRFWRKLGEVPPAAEEIGRAHV